MAEGGVFGFICHDCAWGLRGGGDAENAKRIGQVRDQGGLGVRQVAVGFDDLGVLRVGNSRWCRGVGPEGPRGNGAGRS